MSFFLFLFRWKDNEKSNNPKEISFPLSDLVTFCSEENETKERIRAEQVEGRRLRMEEKKAMLWKLENPAPVVPIKLDRRGRKAGNQYGRLKRSEPEQEVESLPYLPTPNEIILSKEGNFDL